MTGPSTWSLDSDSCSATASRVSAMTSPWNVTRTCLPAGSVVTLCFGYFLKPGAGFMITSQMTRLGRGRRGAVVQHVEILQRQLRQDPRLHAVQAVHAQREHRVALGVGAAREGPHPAVAAAAVSLLHAAARSSAAMSSFFICHTACITRSPFFGSAIIAGSPSGTTCQDKPYLSLSQPHSDSWPPPAVSFSQ